ncbi:MAG TPA: hypothetical protein VHI52_23020, partial [Verrucomicrobiae bacterium]|nr:hypothetical protein [Verrucomicrobiae bacterium]
MGNSAQGNAGPFGSEMQNYSVLQFPSHASLMEAVQAWSGPAVAQLVTGILRTSPQRRNLSRTLRVWMI